MPIEVTIDAKLQYQEYPCGCRVVYCLCGCGNDPHWEPCPRHSEHVDGLIDALLEEAHSAWAGEMETDEPIQGSDMVDWFCGMFWPKLVAARAALSRANMEVVKEEMEQIWVLSTAHITESDNMLLLHGTAGDPATFPCYDSLPDGYLIHVTRPMSLCSAGFSSSFNMLYRTAWNRGIRYIRLDPDGPTREGLQKYDW